MQLFLSYGRKSIDTVRETVDILTLGGHSVWFDDQLLPGQDFKEVLGAQISQSNGFVYALTTDTLSSEWCAWELATAIGFGKVILPIRLEPALSFPAPLERLQYADFSQGAPRREVAKLMRALGDKQRIMAADAPPIPADPKGIPSRAWDNFKPTWTDVFT